MDQIILEHFGCKLEFLSLLNFLVPFLKYNKRNFDKNNSDKNNLYFDNDKVFYNDKELGIYIKDKIDYWCYYYTNGMKLSEQFYSGKYRGYYIDYYSNETKKEEGINKDCSIQGFWIFYDLKEKKFREGNIKNKLITFFKNGKLIETPFDEFKKKEIYKNRDEIYFL